MSIELHQVSVKAGKRSILRNVSLSFLSPLTYVVGLNGSGKTTLLRTITREVDYEGKVLLGGKDNRSINTRERAKLLAVVHQRINIPFQIKVFDFVLMGRYAHLDWLGGYGGQDRDRVGEEMARLGISGLQDRGLDEISGGELQKVLLARALVQDTPWLLLDEPGQQLDPRSRKELYQMLSELAEEGKKIICSTHDREPLEAGIARVVGLKDGSVLYDETGENDWEMIWNSVYA